MEPWAEALHGLPPVLPGLALAHPEPVLECLAEMQTRLLEPEAQTAEAHMEMPEAALEEEPGGHCLSQLVDEAHR